MGADIPKRIGDATHESATVVLLQMRLVQGLHELNLAGVAGYFGQHVAKRLRGLAAVSSGMPLLPTQLPTICLSDLLLLRTVIVAKRAYGVDSNHQCAFVNHLESEECAVAELMIGDELCPPSSDRNS